MMPLLIQVYSKEETDLVPNKKKKKKKGKRVGDTPVK